EFTSISEKIICSFFGLLILYKRLFKKGQHKSILHDGLRGLPYVK
ncbi:MAG: phytoene/squalene synthase family protein, partial [Rhodobacterales bacterium]|nr:phytoene/squalene synthase family protein [Rhodobacterales bacterium]